MKLILLHSKKPPVPGSYVHSYSSWYVVDDFYEVRCGELKSRCKPVIRYDEWYNIFYIIHNEDDGFRYRNTRFKKL